MYVGRVRSRLGSSVRPKFSASYCNTPEDLDSFLMRLLHSLVSDIAQVTCMTSRGMEKHYDGIDEAFQGSMPAKSAIE